RDPVAIAVEVIVLPSDRELTGQYRHRDESGARGPPPARPRERRRDRGHGNGGQWVAGKSQAEQGTRHAVAIPGPIHRSVGWRRLEPTRFGRASSAEPAVAPAAHQVRARGL